MSETETETATDTVTNEENNQNQEEATKSFIEKGSSPINEVVKDIDFKEFISGFPKLGAGTYTPSLEYFAPILNFIYVHENTLYNLLTTGEKEGEFVFNRDTWISTPEKERKEITKNNNLLNDEYFLNGGEFVVPTSDKVRDVAEIFPLILEVMPKLLTEEADNIYALAALNDLPNALIGKSWQNGQLKNEVNKVVSGYIEQDLDMTTLWSKAACSIFSVINTLYSGSWGKALEKIRNHTA